MCELTHDMAGERHAMCESALILSRYSPRIDVDDHGQPTFHTLIVTILFLAFLEIHSREMLLETMDMLNVF
jgi:hypothetical protein